jgi:hypothetical protein
MSSKPSKPELALFPSYIAAIENSVGSNLFRKLYYRIDGKDLDVLDDGDLSCAVYVTTILYMFDLIGERHTTVTETIKDLIASSWYEIQEPRPGALMHWDYKIKNDGTRGTNRHVGFYLDEQSAVSNSSVAKMVVKHPPKRPVSHDSDGERDILAYYWHDKLN